jgi:hypothetical protein
MATENITQPLYVMNRSLDKKGSASALLVMKLPMSQWGCLHYEETIEDLHRIERSLDQSRFMLCSHGLVP